MEQSTTVAPGGALRWLGTVSLWVLILGVLAAVTAAVVVPRLGDATPYTILTGSMRPAMPPGTLVVVRPVPPEEIGVGTVVAYQLTSGEPTVVTHRVVATGTNTKGEPVFRTQGDANDILDAAAIRPVQIHGELWYSVPYLGYASVLISGDQRHAATLVLAGGLALYALAMFTAEMRGRFRTRRGVAGHPPAQARLERRWARA